jgi:hypothetical protein
MSPRAYEQCPVNYGVHFSRTYTDFVHAAIKAGLGHEVLHHSITSGNLSQQDESWSLTRKMQLSNFFSSIICVHPNVCPKPGDTILYGN